MAGQLQNMGKICTDTLTSCFIGSESFAGVEYDISNSFGAFIPKIGSATLEKPFLGEEVGGGGSGRGSAEICGKYVLRRFQAVYGEDYNEKWKI